jgi:hypothetical protein
MKAELRKAIAGLLVMTVTSASLSGPATAGTVGTESALASDRERILVVIDRPDVRSMLEARGVSAEEAKARIDALTDAEAAQLAQQIESAPAGARNPLAILAIPVVLVIGAAYLIALLIGGLVALASKASSSKQADRQAAGPVAQADVQ